MPAIRSALAPAALALLAFASLAAAEPPAGAPDPGEPDASASAPKAGGPEEGMSASPQAPARRVYPSRGRLGIEVQPMTAELREFFSAPSDRGVLVVHVEAGRAAQLAGIAVGDVLIAAGGAPIERPVDLITAVARAPAGSKLAIELLQKGQKRTVEVVPEGEAIADFAAPPHWRSAHPGDPHPPYEGLDERIHELEQRIDRLEHSPAPDR